MSSPVLYRVKPIFEQLSTLGLAVDYHAHYVNREVVQHTVDVVLISYIMRGTATHFLDDESFIEGPGCLTITHYNQAHDIVTDPRGIAIYNLFIDLQRYPLPQMPECLRGFLARVLPLNPIFTHQQNRRIRLQFDDTEIINALFLAMYKESADRPPGFEEMLHLLFRAFLIKCCRWVAEHGITPLRTPILQNEKRVEEIRYFLETHPEDPHTLENLAKRIGWSRGLLCRRFKAYTGKNLFSYLVELRIQNAMVRLCHTDEKVLAVALNSGFNNVAHFNQSFRRYVGVPPSEYRRQVRGNRP